MANPDLRAFLDVEHSLSGNRWTDRLDLRGRNEALAISQTSGIPEIVGRVLAGRGVSADEAEGFLAPTLRDLMPDPSSLTAMDEAAVRIAAAITAGERVAIFGDYDVDGAASAALLARFLTAFGVPHEIYIPDRIFEGYGPNPDAIRQLIGNGAKLIVTVDCGSTSFESLETAREMGVDVVVLDHHQLGSELPAAKALVNPNRQDDLSGLGYLCAAGVVFMTLVAVQRELRRQGQATGPNLMQMLDLVALATVCDVVPLTGLNRAFVVRGLDVLRDGQKGGNAGLEALARAARLDGPASTYHLAFLLGPRINAGGRVGDAALGSRLLSTDDREQAEQIAAELERLNAERQRAEAAMLEEAMAEGEAETARGEGPAVLVTAREGWHPGIVGLLASRLKERFSRPAIAIAFDRNGKGSGSGRSISGVDLGAAVRGAVEAGVLEKGGGHAMAAGLTVDQGKLGELRAYMEDALAEAIGKARAVHSLKVDAALSARAATLELVDLLEQAGPYGAGHPQPMLAFPGHTVTGARVVGRDHVSFTLRGSDGASLRAIAFRKANEPVGEALLSGKYSRFHVAGVLSADHWQGRRRVQLRVTDVAVAT